MPNYDVFNTLEEMAEAIVQMPGRIQKMQDEIDGLKASQVVFEFFMSKVVPEVFSVDERAEFEAEILARILGLTKHRADGNERS